MVTEKIKLINKFYGGMTRDEKSRIQGVSSNIEEIDIFTNADFIQAEQIFSSDSLPASTEAYAYTSGSDGTAYAYGKETSGNKVRLLSVASGGSTDPGAWSTLFTSADTTNLAYAVSPIQYHKTTEANSNYLYYCTKTSGTTVVLKRYDITGATEATVGTLTQLSGSYDRISMKVMFGELYITNGKYITKVDEDGVFTEDAFTLPIDWIAVDITPVSDVAIILSRYIDRTVNFSKGYWWDLTASVQVDDSFDIPSGGPQWVQNHKETIKLLCAINGTARMFQLSGAFPGAIPLELPGLVFENVATEGATQPISAPKTVATKDKILYYGLYKTDKTGVYAVGQIDSDKPVATLLSKRYNTTDYSLHAPTALMIQGPNFYAAYSDNGTATTMRCESQNSPSRSTQGIYESIWIDDDDPISDKQLTDVFVSVKPTPASTDVDVSLASDYSSYTEIFRADGTSLNTTNAVLGQFKSKLASQKKVFKVKLKLVSTTSTSPKVTSIGLKMFVQEEPAPN
jgi:hypothetical protein